MDIFHGGCSGHLLSRYVPGKHSIASPAAWSAISALLVRAYKRRGHGMRHSTPISRRPFDSAGILFVNDTYLLSLNPFLSSRALWEEVQANTTMIKTGMDTLNSSTSFKFRNEAFFQYLKDKRLKVFYY